MTVNLRTLVVEVTERCNNRCAHCYNFWRGNGSLLSRPLPRSAIRDLVDKVLQDAPIEQVALSGGEPFMRPDLPEITTDILDMGLGVVVITNGSLLDREVLRRFPRGCVFEVTLFSATPAVHDSMAGRKRHEKLLNDLAALEESGFSLVIATVITSRNTQNFTRTIQMAIALRAKAILLNRVNLGREMYLHSPELVPSGAQLRKVLQQADAATKKYGIAVSISVPIPPCVADPRDYPHLHFGWCPRGGADAYYTIGTTGEVRPCNHSSVVLGDLKKLSFRKIVQGRKAREFWSPVPTECQKCTHPLRDSCRGGCPAAAGECYGSRWRLDPFVGLSNSQTNHAVGE